MLVKTNEGGQELPDLSMELRIRHMVKQMLEKVDAWEKSQIEALDKNLPAEPLQTRRKHITDTALGLREHLNNCLPLNTKPAQYFNTRNTRSLIKNAIFEEAAEANYAIAKFSQKKSHKIDDDRLKRFYEQKMAEITTRPSYPSAEDLLDETLLWRGFKDTKPGGREALWLQAKADEKPLILRKILSLLTRRR